MPRMTALFLAAFLVSAVGCQAAAAADLSVYRHGGYGVGTYNSLGFGGQAFPYGYQWSLARACTRYEPVETKYGTRMEKVWVCAARRHYYR